MPTKIQEISPGHLDQDRDWGLSSRLSFVKGRESVRNFAKRIGVKESTFRSIQKGTRPSIDLVIQVANATGVSIEWLATGKGSPYRTRRAKSDQGAPEQAVLPHIHRDVFMLVAEAVERAHLAEDFFWSPGSVAAETMDAYDELVDTVWEITDLDEVRAIIPWIEYNLRAVLRAGKRHDSEND